MSMQISYSGVMAASRDLSVVSNNLANAMTTGFKRSSSNFLEANGLDGANVIVSDKQGGLKVTQSGFDFALTGQGRFVFGEADPAAGIDQGLSYSRAGQLKLGTNGNLIDNSGRPLMGLTLNGGGTPKAINILPAVDGDISKLSSISVDVRGVVSVVNSKGVTTKVAAIAVARFSNEAGLRSAGNSQVVETDRSGPAILSTAGANGTGEIRQGILEESNVDLTQEMLRMIQLQQGYNANSRGLQTSSEMLRSTIETLAR